MSLIQTIDQQSLTFLYNFADTNNFSRFIFTNTATYGVYLVPILLLYLWFKKSPDSNDNKILSLKIFLVGIFAWGGIASAVKHFYYRARPFENSLLNVREIMLHRPDNSFPSDHASFLFGIAFALYFFKKPSLANWFLFIAILVSVARIAVGVHYTSDILGGVVVGLLSAIIIYILRSGIEKYIVKPLISFAKKIKLA